MGKLFFNGEILTLNAEDELAEALLTQGEEIVYVGSLDDALSLADARTEMTDLAGCALMSLCAYRLLPTVARIASDYSEVPSLLRTLGGKPLEWGTPAELVILGQKLIGCPPGRLCELCASGEPTCQKEPISEGALPHL